MPHPRSYGTFPRFFGKYVRDEKIMDMSTAVMKATSLPASRLKLKGRGLLQPGYFADINVINLPEYKDLATYAKPHVFCKGVEHVFVNGIHTIKDGAPTGSRGGIIFYNPCCSSIFSKALTILVTRGCRTISSLPKFIP